MFERRGNCRGGGGSSCQVFGGSCCVLFIFIFIFFLYNTRTAFFETFMISSAVPVQCISTANAATKQRRKA